jgi:hypothetical protein
MRDWLLFILFLAVAGLAYCVRFWLPAFIRRKAENLAQKQDITDLTERVQRVETQFERVRLVHRVQFEAEFKHYEKVWKKADRVNGAFVRVYPVHQFHEITDELVKDFGDRLDRFGRVLERSKPFISAEIWKMLNEYETLLIEGKANFITGTPTENVREYREEVRHVYELCAERIRLHLASQSVL